MKKKKDIDEKLAKNIFNLFFKLLEDKRVPLEVRSEYIERIGDVVHGEKNCT